MPRPPLRALLLDLDGTLHDKAASDARIAARQFDEAGLAGRGIGRGEWIAAFVDVQAQRIDKPAAFARLRAQFDLPPGTTARLLADFDANYGECAVPFPGARELLVAARAAGLKLGIVTNGRDRLQRRKIAALGFGSLVESVVTSGAFGIKKPDPAIFLAALAELNTPAGATAFIGDDLQSDIEPAARLGMQPVWKSNAGSSLAVFSRDDLAAIRGFVLARA